MRRGPRMSEFLSTKVISVLEIAAALGLILPGLLHIAPVLMPLAAAGGGWYTIQGGEQYPTR